MTAGSLRDRVIAACATKPGSAEDSVGRRPGDPLLSVVIRGRSAQIAEREFSWLSRSAFLCGYQPVMYAHSH